MRRDDTLWKGLIEDLFPEFLQFFYPRAEGLLVGDASVDFLDKELGDPYPKPGAQPTTMVVDKLVRVRTTIEKEEWILMHVEVQGYRQREFSERMYNYYSRIRELHSHPVTAIAIVMGGAGTTKGFYEEETLGTTVLYRYNVYNIHTVDEVDLYKNRNPFALIVQAARLSYEKGRIPDERIAEQFVGLFDVLSARELPHHKKLVMWAFIRSCVQFANPEMYGAFDKLLEQVTTKNEYMGVLEMIEERGRLEGLDLGRVQGFNDGYKLKDEKFVRYLLEALHLSDDQIAQIVEVSQNFIDTVKQQMKQQMN